MNKKYVLLLVAILALAAVVWFVVNRSTDGTQVLPIGAIAPLSGENAQFGTALRQGMELALTEVNEQAAARGARRLALHVEDSQGQPVTGVNAFRKLVDFNRTPIVLGAMFSQVTMAIAPIAESRHVVLLSPTSSDVALTTAGDYIFRIYPSDTYDGEFLARYVAEQKDVQRIAVLYLTTSSTTAIATVFSDLVKDEGREIVLLEGHDEGTQDFRTLLQKVQRAEPDAVMLFSYLNEMALILRQAQEMGYRFRFLAISTIFDSKIFELAGDAADGVVFSTAVYDPASDEPLIREFVARFEEAYGAEPNIWSAYGYDAVRVAAAAVWNSDGSPESIKEALYDIRDFPGVTGTTTFDKNGDVQKALQLMTIRDGEFVPVTP